MIRAIVGTVAVLAGFAVLERSVDASTGQAGSCTPTEAYALLPRGEAVPVRTDPTPQAAVIGTLSGRRSGNTDPARAAVTITGSQNGWARIALATAHDYSASGTAQPYGWIPADLLVVDARVDGVITVYDRPGERSGPSEPGDAAPENAVGVELRRDFDRQNRGEHLISRVERRAVMGHLRLLAGLPGPDFQRDSGADHS